MFDWPWIDELDRDAAADALVEARRELLAAEAKQFALAAHWADLHAGEDLDPSLAQLPGAQRLVPIRGGRNGCADGCPEVEEYAGAELAAYLGRSTITGEQLIADALAVRHRHPSLWSGIRAGTAPVWLAAQVARRCIRAQLDGAQAEWVDAETTPFITTLPPKRFLDLVEAKIIAADPDAAEERAKEKALSRFVRTGQTDEHGLRTLVARANAGDITYLVAVLDRIAMVLAERGDHRPLDVLRAEALRILGNPARALALLTEATLDELDPALETPGDLGQHALFPYGDTGTVRDAHGHDLPGAYPVLAELPLVDTAELLALPEYQALIGSGASAGPVGGSGGEDLPADPVADRALLTALLQALNGFDASRLDPHVTVHVHISEAALTARQGVARVEELGPAVLAEVRDWLVNPFHPDHLRQRVTVRPVLDADAVVPVDRHEWPAPMEELTTCRTPYEAFPFGTLPSRRADDDHAKRYVANGPPGQTCLENNAKLGRFHHRLKTNGNWVLRHPDPGSYWWRTPQGHWFLVDTEGTHWHGRDPALDEQHLHQDDAA